MFSLGSLIVGFILGSVATMLDKKLFGKWFFILVVFLPLTIIAMLLGFDFLVGNFQ